MDEYNLKINKLVKPNDFSTTMHRGIWMNMFITKAEK